MAATTAAAQRKWKKKEIDKKKRSKSLNDTNVEGCRSTTATRCLHKPLIYGFLTVLPWQWSRQAVARCSAHFVHSLLLRGELHILYLCKCERALLRNRCNGARASARAKSNNVNAKSLYFAWNVLVWIEEKATSFIHLYTTTTFIHSFTSYKENTYVAQEQNTSASPHFISATLGTRTACLLVFTFDSSPSLSFTIHM